MVAKRTAFAACLVTLANAATAQSNVTISGVLDEFGAVHRTGGQATYRVDSSGLAGSRLIFRGSEELDSGGLKANFFLESGFNPDAGSQADPTRIWNRQAWVGLSSTGTGELKFGRLTSLQFFMEGQFDAFQGATMGSSFNNLIAYTVRFDNGLQYTSPSLGPVKLHAIYALNEGTTGRKAAGAVLAAEYRSGPLYVGLNHADVQNTTTLVTTKTTFAGGNCEFGDAKLFLGYFQAKASNGAVDRQTIGVSGQYKLTSSLALVAGAARANDKTAINADGSHVGVGAFYELSKRTLIYTNVSRMNNSGAAATYSLNGATALGVVPAAGSDVSGAQLGIRHAF